MHGYEYLVNFLEEEGFRKTDEGNYFSFKYEGNTFVAFKNESPFLQVLQLIKAEGHSREKLLETCNKMNDNKFIIKFTVHDDVIWCSYELRPNEHTTTQEFGMIMPMLDRASDEFYEELKK